MKLSCVFACRNPNNSNVKFLVFADGTRGMEYQDIAGLFLETVEGEGEGEWKMERQG